MEQDNRTKQFLQIQSCIRQMVLEGVICGASLGFIKDGKPEYYYFGVQGKTDPYRDRPVAEGMLYDLASLTKVVGTTCRILQMTDQGILDFQTRVSDILPRFGYPAIKTGHLLLHNSGLPAEIRNKESWDRAQISEYLYTTAPICKPEDRFIYSDVGFILLGKMIEALDGMTLEESFKTHIFTPLGMSHTSFVTDPLKGIYIPTECTKERGCICGEVHDKKAYLLGQCASAGLFSTLGDVVRFAGCLLDQSSLLFSKETFDRLWQMEQFKRTFGFGREYGPGTLYHTGFTGTSILVDHNLNQGFVLLTNRIHPTRDNPLFLEKRKLLNEIFLGRV